MNVVTPNPLPPPTERMFENSGVGGIGKNPGTDTTDPSVYEYIVRALIDDAKSFEDSTLAPDREENLEYFYGEKPEIENTDDEVSLLVHLLLVLMCVILLWRSCHP